MHVFFPEAGIAQQLNKADVLILPCSRFKDAHLFVFQACRSSGIYFYTEFYLVRCSSYSVSSRHFSLYYIKLNPAQLALAF